MRLHALRKMKSDIDHKTWFKAISVWWLIIFVITAFGALMGFLETAHGCGGEEPEPIVIKVRL